GFGEEPLEPLALGEVDADPAALADLVDPLETVLQVLLVAPAGEDLDALRGQQHPDRAADSGRPAGNDRLAPFERGHLGMRVAQVRVGIGQGMSPSSRRRTAGATVPAVLHSSVAPPERLTDSTRESARA